MVMGPLHAILGLIILILDIVAILSVVGGPGLLAVRFCGSLSSCCFPFLA